MYSYRVRRTPKPEPVAEPEQPTYRELQAEAKALGIPANQSAEDLAAALSEESDDE